MRNNYEMPEVFELGRAESLILGVKYIAPFDYDLVLGLGFVSWFLEDIDESDE